jgi:hypothetical protein
LYLSARHESFFQIVHMPYVYTIFGNHNFNLPPFLVAKYIIVGRFDEFFILRVFVYVQVFTSYTENFFWVIRRESGGFVKNLAKKLAEIRWGFIKSRGTILILFTSLCARSFNRESFHFWNSRFSFWASTLRGMRRSENFLQSTLKTIFSSLGISPFIHQWIQIISVA